MTYNNICEGIFRLRINRFVAEVEINGNIERCHVKNTGRCKELLVPGARVYLNQSDKPERSTKYDLITVWKGNRLINMDSQAPNQAFLEYLQLGRYIDGITQIKPEAKYGDSRFDFYLETVNNKIFIEVKGVTLEKDNIALFPDAPTERGIKHLNELAQSIKHGYEAHVVFIIQMKDIDCFMPNYEIHPEFGAVLSAAHAMGVKVNALDCIITPDSMAVGALVPVKLEG